MSARKLTKSLRAANARAVRDGDQNMQLGQILTVTPLKIELFDSRIVLDDEELTLTQWMKRYHAVDVMDVGDTVVLVRKHTGGEIHWLVSDCLSDKAPTL